VDGDRFDTVLRALSRRGSRRQALRGLVPALAALASGSASARDLRHGAPTRPAAGRRRGHAGVSAQVTGGTAVPQGKYPFAVSLHMRGATLGFLCSGSLVGPSHVLTAAHCTIDPISGAPFPPSAYTVVVGQVDRTTTRCRPCQKRVTAVAPAPVTDRPHDVAVLTLDAPVDSRIAQPIALIGSDDRRRDSAGQRAVVAGWGLTTDGGSASRMLMEAPLTDGACGRILRQ
jgi:secreted trypsin-like serine protease